MADFRKALGEGWFSVDAAGIDSARMRVAGRISERRAPVPRRWHRLATGAVFATALAVAWYQYPGDDVIPAMATPTAEPRRESPVIAPADPPSADPAPSIKLRPRPGPTVHWRSIDPLAQASAPARLPAASAKAIDPLPAAAGGMGKLVGIASGGTCSWAIDARSAGSGSSVTMNVPVGMHTISCTPAGAASLTQRKNVELGKPAMALFKLGS